MKGKSFFLWALLTLMAVMMAQSIFQYSKPVALDISYGHFREHVRKGWVESVTLNGAELRGKYAQSAEVDYAGKSFVTLWVGSGDELTRFLEEHRVSNFRTVQEEDAFAWRDLVLAILPAVLMFLLLMFLFRQMQGGTGKAFSFGKAKIRQHSENDAKVTFKDVAGIDECKEELEEIIDFLKDPKKFTRLGGRIPKGVLLIGSPGTGKTLLARAIAGEAGVPFFSMSGSDFVEMFVGVGASRVRDLFEQAKKSAPCIVFIDEIDAVGRQRGAGLGGGHDEREQTLNQLLVEMDGFSPNEGIILVAATNRPDVLDPALLRPGRFDRQVVVPRPDLNGRLAILKVHTQNVPLEPSLDLSVIARGTSGFTGADLSNLINEAALLAARENQNRVSRSHIERSRDKILMGKERRTLLMSEEEKRMTAYHEAGHTLVAKMLPEAEPIHKVTIVPRGRALGLTHQLPVEDKYSLVQGYAETMLAILMGGRVAEEVVFQKRTNGAANDIERATDLARQMVCSWGMSDVLGPMTFGESDHEIFLAKEMSHRANYSERTAQLIDDEVRGLISRNYERAKSIITQHRAALERIAQALLEYETLDASQVEALMHGLPITPVAHDGSAAQDNPSDDVAPLSNLVPKPA